jgi:hypothetical protein
VAALAQTDGKLVLNAVTIMGLALNAAWSSGRRVCLNGCRCAIMSFVRAMDGADYMGNVDHLGTVGLQDFKEKWSMNCPAGCSSVWHCPLFANDPMSY